MTCKTCSCYLTDTDENGDVTEFHHDAESKEGFCAIKDLFYDVNENTEACEDYKECKE